MTLIKKLEAQGKIEKIPINPKQVKESITLAERDLEVAKKNLAIDADWSYNISYNSILQAGRALMFSKGYRPKGPYHHVNVEEFLVGILGHEDSLTFDRMRRRRGTATYIQAQTVSHTDALFANKSAVNLVDKIKTIIQNDGFEV